MTGEIRYTMVNKKHFEVWSDFSWKGTFARDIETGETKLISSGGYIHKDLTVRKAIANVFNLPTFRK